MLHLYHACEVQINMIAIVNQVIFGMFSVRFGGITAWSNYR